VIGIIKCALFMQCTHITATKLPSLNLFRDYLDKFFYGIDDNESFLGVTL